MAKVNKDGTIEGEMHIIDEDVDKPKTDEGNEEPEETKKTPSKLKTGLKVAGGVLGSVAVIALSVFAGTKIRK